MFSCQLADREMLEKGGQAFVLYAVEARGDSKERALVLRGGSRSKHELINGLIKKSNQLCEPYTVCHSVIALP